MRMSIKVSPKFNSKIVTSKTIKKYWVDFQDRTLTMGRALHNYMQTFINRNRKRTGGTGNLAKSINFQILATAPATISWGIGELTQLQSNARYWYVLNYGKKITGEQFIPGGGKLVPGYFGGGNRPRSSLKGRGTEQFHYNPGSFVMKPGVIRPMHYIEATTHRLNRRLRLLIATLKKR